MEMAAPTELIAADRSSAYVAYARAQRGVEPVRFVVAAKLDLPGVRILEYRDLRAVPG
jgi:hypothetical protein